MTYPKTHETADAGVHRNIALRRGAVVMGWLLLGAFALICATIGRVGDNVRLFQVAYIGAFVGYLALVWFVATEDRRSHAVSKKSGPLSSSLAKGGSRGVVRLPGNLPQPLLPKEGSEARLRVFGNGASGGWWWLWLVGCVVVRLPMIGMEPSDDAYRYVWEGRIQLVGFNPYVYAPNDPLLSELRTDDWSRINHPDYPAIYAPAAQGQFALAAALYPSIYCIKALHVLWDILTVVVIASVLRRRGRSPHLAIMYGLCPLTLTAFAMDGHLDSLMFLAVALTTWAITTKRMAVAGALLGLAMSTKLIPIVLLPWFVVRHPRAALLAVFVLACTYMPYLAAGPELFQGFGRFSGVEFFSLLGTLRLTNYDTMVARMAVGGLLVMICFVLARRRADFLSFAAGAVSTLILLMPVMHYWYVGFALLFLPFALRARWLVMSFCLVAYFEAARHQELTGAWTMPLWTANLVWGAFLLTWLVEWGVSRKAVSTGDAGA